MNRWDAVWTLDQGGTLVHRREPEGRQQAGASSGRGPQQSNSSLGPGSGASRMRKVDPRIEQRIKELRHSAKAHLSSSQYAEALSCLDLAIDLNTSSYKLYRLRSIAHACMHDYESAASDADKVITLAPNIMDGYYHKGFALFHLKQYADAAHAFQEGLKLNPADKVMRQGFWDAISLVSQNRSQDILSGQNDLHHAHQQASQVPHHSSTTHYSHHAQPPQPGRH